ncbi:MAG: hypothetical protein IKM45_04185 [Opitutales bacterium]|nr:hypothetical protein [Opitutales bacterium]
MHNFEQICNRVFLGVAGTFASLSLPDLASAAAGFATAIYMAVATYKNLKKEKDK